MTRVITLVIFYCIGNPMKLFCFATQIWNKFFANNIHYIDFYIELIYNTKYVLKIQLDWRAKWLIS